MENNIPEKWRHKKTGNLYVVISDLNINSESDYVMVEFCRCDDALVAELKDFKENFEKVEG